MPADLIVVADRLRTMGRAAPGARAVAMGGGRILALGSPDDVAPWRGRRTETIEVPGACLLPGFHDAHVHLGQHGLELGALDLSGAATLDEALALVGERARGVPEGAWVLGAGFSLPRWGIRSVDAGLLDRVARHVPVFLRSQDHHGAWANGLALERAGIAETTSDPEGGVVVRDADGRPTGYLLERAGRLVEAAVPQPDAAALAAAVAAAGRDLARHGLTTVHHMAYEPASRWRAIADTASRDGFELAVWACVPQADLEHAAALGLATGHGGHGFTVGGLKFFADGALGSRTAWMLEPYDGTDERGMVVDDPELLLTRFRAAAEAGFAPVTHAIGDAAVRAVVDALEATQDAWRPRGLRPRIEHVQHAHDDDVRRIGALGLVASMQPIHMTFDAPFIRAVLSGRRTRAYRTRDLAAAGAVLAFGSDTTVASPDVLAGLRAAVDRVDAEGAPFGTDQGLTVEEALAGWTRGAAWAIGREGRSGVLAEGADADLVALDHDPVDGLADLRVLLTVRGGRVTFDGRDG